MIRVQMQICSLNVQKNDLKKIVAPAEESSGSGSEQYVMLKSDVMKKINERTNRQKCCSLIECGRNEQNGAVCRMCWGNRRRLIDSLSTTKRTKQKNRNETKGCKLAVVVVIEQGTLGGKRKQLHRSYNRSLFVRAVF